MTATRIFLLWLATATGFLVMWCGLIEWHDRKERRRRRALDREYQQLCDAIGGKR